LHKLAIFDSLSAVTDEHSFLTRCTMIRKMAFFAALAMTWVIAGDRPQEAVQAAEKEEKSPATKSAPFVHAVIFHLKKDAPEGTTEAILKDVRELLATIPSVREVKAGRPAVKETPDNAKTDFQIGLLVLVDDLDGLKTYIEHPKHKEFVAKHGKFLDRDKLLVFDFANQTK